MLLHLLLRHFPCFLHLSEQWVCALFESGKCFLGNGGECSLSFLLRSQTLGEFDFECDRFKNLFNDQSGAVDL